MAESLQNLIASEDPARLAAMLQRAWWRFPVQAFLADMDPGFSSLALMARGRRIAQALRRHLPANYADAVDVLVRSMGPPMGLDAAGEPDAGDRPHSGFFYLPHSLFIAENGLGHFALSMQAQHALTQRFTAEFSLRRYLEHHQDATLEQLARWTADPSAHVRRLVSEGARPRLPWAPRLSAFVRDPSPTLPLLEALKDDPSSYVRRSVANHLNDIGKDHPAALARVARDWLAGAPPARQRLVRHALRHAVKRGDPQALSALGLGHAVQLAVRGLEIEPARPRVGETVTIAFDLHNRQKTAQRAVADLRVHYVKASGGTAPKVFKLAEVALPAGGTQRLHKKLSLTQMTTRKHYPGAHRAELLLNGRAVPLGEFDLLAPVAR